MLLDLVRIIEFFGFAKMLTGSDRCLSEKTGSNIKSINNLNCSQDGHQVTILRVEMFSVNFVTFAFCKLSFCNDGLENVTGIDAMQPYLLPNKKYLITIFKICQFFMLPVNFRAFW